MGGAFQRERDFLIGGLVRRIFLLIQPVGITSALLFQAGAQNGKADLQNGMGHFQNGKRRTQNGMAVSQNEMPRCQRRCARHIP
ncbi:MAG: hypothetical protein KJZ78_06355 [Bryobacteraceae bacterium]|nr:hypothetical protein [Bryobacteraceae bacterium]